MYTPVNPIFTIYKWGLRGSKLYRRISHAQADLSLRWAHMSEGTFSHVVTHISLCLHVPIVVQIL